METFGNYLYYKGEAENPFEQSSLGKDFWWEVEHHAFKRNDKKEEGRLSKTMKTYILEHHWEGDAQSNTTRELALQRATEMYRMGIWSRSYITSKDYKLEYAIDDSVG